MRFSAELTSFFAIPAAEAPASRPVPETAEVAAASLERHEDRLGRGRVALAGHDAPADHLLVDLAQALGDEAAEQHRDKASKGPFQAWPDGRAT